MKVIYTYIFVLLCFTVFMAYYNTYNMTITEGFEEKPKTIVLLGDSILKNNVYVTKGVDEIMRSKTECKVVSLARDKTTIGHTYKQIDEIPVNLNVPTTVVVLSVGGNDIIENYIDGPYDASEDRGYLRKLFGSYKSLVAELRKKMDNARIVLLDIYYPANSQYKEYYPLIKSWNKQQGEYSKEVEVEQVIKISEALTKPQDFAFDIEPSDKGGKKIVEAILSSIE
jgi:hypothetical protein